MIVSEMGEDDLKGMFQATAAPGIDGKRNIKHDDHDQKHGDRLWIMNNMEDTIINDIKLEDDDENENVSITSESSLGEYSRSNNSQGSTSSSSDLLDDASSSSSSTSNSSTNCNGPLYELSELMAQLPIKRGLSKYFQGKSQSFTFLSSVKSIEELAKKESPYRKKMKACRSFGGGLDTHRLYTLPRATISKKVSRNSLSSLSFSGRAISFSGRARNSFLSGRPPLVPVQRNLSSL